MKKARIYSRVLTVFFASLSAAFAGEGGASVYVDATRLGSAIPNVSQVLTVWNGATFDWSVQESREFPVGDFVEYVELMACTGGSADRDLLRDPADRAVLDDYDFAPLVRACRGILAHGAKPYLKLGNVPAKFTEDHDGGEFHINIRPPADHAVHYRYMKACAEALKSAFGRDEVRTWRFAVLTEADNAHWFKAKRGGKAATRDEFFRLYDYAVRAFEETLGEGLVIGSHFLNPRDAGAISQFGIEDFIVHCASGTNAATGGVGAPLRLLTISYYHRPGGDDIEAGRVAEMKRVVEAAREHGFTNLVAGVDEGRVIVAAKGRDRRDLVMRALGASYEAAFDVRVVRSILDAGADYCASWGFFSGPCHAYEGVPSHHYFASRELARLAGLRRVEAGTDGASAGSELDVLAGASQDGGTVRVAVSRFRDRIVFTNGLEVMVRVQLPKEFAGKTVTVDTLMLDDRSNWFCDWERDRVKFGVTAADFSWSPDDFAVLAPRGLTTPRFRELFAAELQKGYARRARAVVPVSRRHTADKEGMVTLSLNFAGNGAAFILVSGQGSGGRGQ